MTLWHLGNTTVRTPYRLRDALRVLQGSPLNGNISGNDQENAFATLLHKEGVVDAPRVEEGKDASDLGRKWRSALDQLGFITPQLTTKTKNGIPDPKLVEPVENIKELSGRPYEITPNGYRLANAEIITAQQECFLRSFASYQIPSVIESRYKMTKFSPLRYILQIIHGLETVDQSGIITIQEFGLFIQTTTPADGVDNTVQKIINYRNGRMAAKGKVKIYDREMFEQVSKEIGKAYNTIKNDYPDVSFRYLKATGVFRRAGRGIALAPSRAKLAALLRDEQQEDISDNQYLQSLWRGAELPTDNAASSYTVVTDLIGKLNARGENYIVPDANMALPDLENIRHELEERALQLDEQEYADNQADKIDEIMAWFKAIPTRGSAKTSDGHIVSIPKGEGPAYLEWIIWRSFLAIDSLCNAPWEARRFQIDQDFLPVHCAPGGGPDMVFEFDNAVIVVEVTLTASSRQEAVEGEPVRRHVAQYTEKFDKPVFGLFIAVKIDSNTAHTFRSGDWYLKDDNKLSLDIVPLTLEDFGAFFLSGKGRLSDMPSLLRQLMIECRAKANQDAPTWKQSISQIVNQVSSGA